MKRSDRLYATALHKHFILCERLTPAEARELRRRRLATGGYPVPQAADATRPINARLVDPRMA